LSLLTAPPFSRLEPPWLDALQADESSEI